MKTSARILKTLFIILIITWINNASFAQNYSISGRITYKNTINSTLDSCLVKLYCNGNLIATDTTDYDGLYAFDNLPAGIYYFQIVCPKLTGGYAATDALSTMRHFVGQQYISPGLNLDASDVNGDGYPNSIDALLIERKFVGAIAAFPHGTWIFDATSSVTLSNVSLVYNIKALCYGDVNASYIPIHSHPSN